MYSNPYASKSKTMSNTTIIYGNDVTYKNGTYTLENTITSSNWTDIYNEGLNNNHYTCFSTNNTCTTVYYIYFTNPTKAYYIELTNGKKVEDALKIMLGTNDSKIKSYNTTSNSIKGNNTTSETLDYWYYTNIKQKGYNNYIKDTIWYNDRGIYDYAG